MTNNKPIAPTNKLIILITIGKVLVISGCIKTGQQNLFTVLLAGSGSIHNRHTLQLHLDPAVVAI